MVSSIRESSHPLEILNGSDPQKSFTQKVADFVKNIFQRIAFVFLYALKCIFLNPVELITKGKVTSQMRPTWPFDIYDPYSLSEQLKAEQILENAAVIDEETVDAYLDAAKKSQLTEAGSVLRNFWIDQDRLTCSNQHAKRIPFPVFEKLIRGLGEIPTIQQIGVTLQFVEYITTVQVIGRRLKNNSSSVSSEHLHLYEARKNLVDQYQRLFADIGFTYDEQNFSYHR